MKRSVEASIKAERPPSDREQLRGDLRERLLSPAIDKAADVMRDGREAVSALVLKLSQEFEIVLRKDFCSDALMFAEIHATAVTLR